MLQVNPSFRGGVGEPRAELGYANAVLCVIELSIRDQLGLVSLARSEYQYTRPKNGSDPEVRTTHYGYFSTPEGLVSSEMKRHAGGMRPLDGYLNEHSIHCSSPPSPLVLRTPARL
jgi:hypothetical protein